MKKYSVFIGAVLLISCRVTTIPITAPDGKLGHALTCQTMGFCYEKAGKICGQNGYKILNKYDGNGFSISNLIIKCKKKK